MSQHNHETYRLSKKPFAFVVCTAKIGNQIGRFNTFSALLKKVDGTTHVASWLNFWQKTLTFPDLLVNDIAQQSENSHMVITQQAENM